MKLFSALILITLPILTSAAAQGSTKNFYLVTCTDGSGRRNTYDAIAYYPKGAAKSNTEWPHDLAEVSRPKATWEGVVREAEFENDSWFIARIDKGAASLKAGEIAGTGEFEGEPFVCFKRSGETLFADRPVSCQQLYWCPSIDVSGGNKPGAARRRR
ncbi:hypothetical protein B0J11DRAFT_341479 [Dendryphion nanum]|uniref:DUF3757 domain-containing protein n=1 Tax=Dendryphion nanum TaxID=256645 RepID=A0A9P9DP85_9PLEO|nr:hypothetical protein B0J11DRAFT_341479 [Dendryphion nanum]